MRRVVKSAPPPGGDRREFVMSDGSVDRMGDVIDQDGWDLSSFVPGSPTFNPIALFNHDKNQVVGSWLHTRVSDGKLISKFVPLEPGTSEIADSVRKMVEQNVLRAVSVGFEPIEREPLHEKAHPQHGPFRFRRQALLECSIVSVPANPNAVAIAKQLNLSSEMVSRVFGEHAETRRRGDPAATGEHAVIKSSIERPTKMTTLSQRIEDTQTQLNAARDRTVNEAADLDINTLDQLNAEIREHERALTVLKESEARTAAAATAMVPYTAPVRNAVPIPSPSMAAPHAARRPFGEKEYDLIELLSRAAWSKLLAKAKGISVDDARQLSYGEHMQTRDVCEITLKAAVAPALTSVSGWASQLVGSAVNAPMLPQLLPMSVYGPLSSMGVRLTFGRNGTVNVPSRLTTPTIAGSFVGEGAPIPVRQAGFTSIPLVPKKMAVITTWSREMDEHSEPAIRPLLEESIRQDTSISIDTILLDANPATTIRPAGLRNGVAALTATTGGGFAALLGDISQLISAILTATNGNIRALTFLMNPKEAWKISLTTSPGAGGLFPFRDEINNNRLNGYSVIQSGTVPVGTVIVVDAADYVSVTGDNPRFEVSDTATLHMEDTTPLHIGTAGSPATVAAPVQSMFQTDSMALRLILPMNWAMRRTGMIAWVASVTW